MSYKCQSEKHVTELCLSVQRVNIVYPEVTLKNNFMQILPIHQIKFPSLRHSYY